MCVCMCVCMYVCMYYVCVYVCTYVYMHACMHVLMYVCTYVWYNTATHSCNVCTSSAILAARYHSNEPQRLNSNLNRAGNNKPYLPLRGKVSYIFFPTWQPNFESVERFYQFSQISRKSVQWVPRRYMPTDSCNEGNRHFARECERSKNWTDKTASDCSIIIFTAREVQSAQSRYL
jgi:hypothetical protein